MGTGTLRRHYGGYDSRQMGRIEDQPRERILEAYYAERDRLKRIESELIARGVNVTLPDGTQLGAGKPLRDFVPSLAEYLAAGGRENDYQDRFFGWHPSKKDFREDLPIPSREEFLEHAGRMFDERFANRETPPAAETTASSPAPVDPKHAEELERIARETAYPVGANAGNETNRIPELLPGQDLTDAEPSKSVSLTPEKAENGDHPIDADALEEAKKPIVENTTSARKPRGK